MDWSHEHDLLIREIVLQVFHHRVYAAAKRTHVLCEATPWLPYGYAAPVDIFFGHLVPLA